MGYVEVEQHAAAHMQHTIREKKTINLKTDRLPKMSYKLKQCSSIADDFRWDQLLVSRYLQKRRTWEIASITKIDSQMKQNREFRYGLIDTMTSTRVYFSSGLATTITIRRPTNYLGCLVTDELIKFVQ
uniref:Uncharacterized protein n=1 Tax=Romanomermis culicivorax TaxID=13658 RepID=A0A915JIR9_ROMCU